MEPSAMVTRRQVLQGIGIGAMGLAGAALLGCGGSKSTDTGSAPVSQATSVAGATRGQGLPLVAPKVEGKVKPGGTWTTAATTQGKQLDSHTALGAGLHGYIGEKGIEPHPITNALLPHVLTSWEVADPSGTTLIFKVHPKLFVHNVAPWNGRQFNAEDVAFNLMRIGGMTADKEKIPLSSFQRASMVANITKAEAVDNLTVKVTLSRPNTGFFAGLTENRVPFMPKEMPDIGFKDPMKFGGIGAFQVAGWENDRKMSFKKNPRYAEFRPSEPYFDNWDHIVIPDTAGLQAAFVSGQIQQIDTPNPDMINTIKKGAPAANLYTTVDQNWQHIRPSVTFEPFKDFRVRKALFMAGDYKAMAEGYYGDGWAYQASLNPMFPEAWGPDKVKALPGYNPDTKEKDRAEAKKMLEAAGYPNGKGLDFEIIYQNPSEVNKENATRFQSQLSSFFTDMKFRLRPYADSASFAVPQAEGKFQILAYTITCVPDAVLELTSQYHTKGSRNYGKFSDAKLDDLMDKAIVELDNKKRTAMLEEAQQKFMDEWMPMYVLYAQPRKNMIQGNVGGFDTTWGITYGYATQTKVCRWYYVEK